eukprot:SAG22_NODE_708_length_7748_cov_3.772650_3_plen_662_part_00
MGPPAAAAAAEPGKASEPRSSAGRAGKAARRARAAASDKQGVSQSRGKVDAAASGVGSGGSGGGGMHEQQAQQQQHRGGEAAASAERQQEVHTAAAAGDAARLGQLLEQDPALANAQDSHGRTPLHVALHQSSVQLLLCYGADTHVAKGSEPAATWHRARGRPDLADRIELRLSPGRVQKLLQRGLVPSAEEECKRALALASAGTGDPDVERSLRLIQNKIAELQHAKSEAVRFAGEELYVEALGAWERALSIAPESEQLQDKVSFTRPMASMQAELLALRQAAGSATQQVATAALTPPRKGKAKLARSASGRQFVNGAEVLRLLDQGQILINGQDEQGCTPLFWATVHGMDDLVALLLAQRSPDKACPNIANNAGLTPLHVAPTVQTAARLLKAGAHIEPREGSGSRTPAEHHRQYGRPEIAAVITRFGPVYNCQGTAEHRLACGDAAGAAATFGDAMQLVAGAMATATPRTQSVLTELMGELRVGQKKAAALSAALAEVDFAHAKVFGARPRSIADLGALAEDASGLDKLAGQVQAVLDAREPGRWRLEGALGAGSAGLVLKASDKIRREVAIKLVRPAGMSCDDYDDEDDSSSEQRRRPAGLTAPLTEEDGCFGVAEVGRLRREAKAMMRVDHPAVCSCHEYFFWPAEVGVCGEHGFI